MVIAKESNIQVNILIKSEKLEQVDYFKYLGSYITSDCRSQIEVRKRIAMGKKAFNKKKVLLTHRLNLELKKRIIKTVVWCVVLYGCETWTLRKDEMKRLEAFEMWIWRRIMKISWKDHVTNEEVLRRVNEKRIILDIITRRQRNWIGHILRGNSLMKEILEGRLQEKRAKGKPR
jgi:hypothetical protein